ncbi:MAG: hypothetical protein U9Q07_03195 [Planctomycetota bacterium]|nr:hypothetical protein [Planctomycetota bacterium]
MAWIKMQTDLSRKPKVQRICRLIGGDIRIAEVCGGCFLLWALFDEQSEDGALRGYDNIDIDAAVGISGFADALCDDSVGWLSIDGDISQLIDPGEHNGESDQEV